MADPRAYLYEDRLDFLGNKLTVGDEVALINPWYRELVKGTLIKILPKTLKIKFKLGNSDRETTRYSEQVIKANKDGKE